MRTAFICVSLMYLAFADVNNSYYFGDPCSGLSPAGCNQTCDYYHTTCNCRPGEISLGSRRTGAFCWSDTNCINDTDCEQQYSGKRLPPGYKGAGPRCSSWLPYGPSERKWCVLSCKSDADCSGISDRAYCNGYEPPTFCVYNDSRSLAR
jgi:hypothetical protein